MRLLIFGCLYLFAKRFGGLLSVVRGRSRAREAGGGARGGEGGEDSGEAAPVEGDDRPYLTILCQYIEGENRPYMRALASAVNDVHLYTARVSERCS